MFLPTLNRTIGIPRVAGCFCLVGREILVMRRQRNSTYPLHWAIPSGKLEVGETALQCMVRELNEELGIVVRPDRFDRVGAFIVEEASIRFEYITFALKMSEKPSLTPNPREVDRVEWIVIPKIRKKKVVPYFYNTVNELLDWSSNVSPLLAALPQKEAKGVARREA